MYRSIYYAVGISRMIKRHPKKVFEKLLNDKLISHTYAHTYAHITRIACTCTQMILALKVFLYTKAIIIYDARYERRLRDKIAWNVCVQRYVRESEPYYEGK